MSDLGPAATAVLRLAETTATLLNTRPAEIIVVMGKEAWMRLYLESSLPYDNGPGGAQKLGVYPVRVEQSRDIPDECVYALPAEAFYGQEIAREQWKVKTFGDFLKHILPDALRAVATSRAGGP